MKQVNLLLMSAAMTLASCGGTKDAGEKDTSAIIRRSDIKIENRRMTPEALWAMGRVGSVAVSPDEKQIAYTVSYYSVPENKSNSEVFVMNADGSENVQITNSAWREGEPAWFKNGKKIAFLSSESGSSQVWEMNPDGTERKQLTQYDGDIEGFSFSPDGKKLLFIAQVKTVKSTADKHPDLPKATGIIVNDLMYKHWDEWVTTAPHPFVADFDGNEIDNVTDILEGEPYESPMKPWGGIEQLAWSPASDKVAYTCRKKTGLAYAISTNSDIYIYDLATKKTNNITEDNKGYDTNPQYSPDGKYIAWQSMERDGYEADLNRLFIMNLETGEKRFVSKAFESNVDAFLWNKDSQSIFFIGVWHGETHIYNILLSDDDKLTQLTDGMYDYASLALCGDKIIAKRHSMSMADEIYAVNANRNGTDFADVRQLTFENKHIYDQLEMGKVEPRWMTTTDGKQMLTWVIYPPKFDPNKKYPTLLFCEGGPQSPVSQFWSYRWNFQIMAANDYIIVAPNRRGLPGFGVVWNEAISGDYGGQCMRDYFTAIDEIAKEPFVDKDHLGCVGASFGGFSVYWLAGHHDKRFKTFIAHDGIFNMEMQYLETEEKWFANWDMGGAYWEKNNATAQRTFANSPHLFVDKWDTPILCIHGEKDFRILANQAMAAFDAAVMRGVPAELLIYPDENHWVLKPQNGVLWQRTFFEWLDKWLKTDNCK
ncbi:dipeptidyl aminopeptidase/acylaminoacyl peptidase [Bacteroides zoogleoformans]|uniref:Peptidase S9 n=1 Tax=Bacteroides zoogleoformans TaxID=28119 RepID=A0ABM6T9E4_9BACE|nr:S9 family peptidase [Bacteroides zoogleoformans]AVM53442.1 peptidase S9 [Bacteroides zoogleoformans]TWJ17224.1 dipeptidyl aminopeptidase/acylaminoacyl peptidase [Bacteroides zoogleoformans]